MRLAAYYLAWALAAVAFVLLMRAKLKPAARRGVGGWLMNAGLVVGLNAVAALAMLGRFPAEWRLGLLRMALFIAPLLMTIAYIASTSKKFRSSGEAPVLFTLAALLFVQLYLVGVFR